MNTETTVTCNRCTRTAGIDDPMFCDWEATAGGDAVLCPHCLTPEEQQAIDEDAMATIDAAEQWRLKQARELISKFAPELLDERTTAAMDEDPESSA